MYSSSVPDQAGPFVLSAFDLPGDGLSLEGFPGWRKHGKVEKGSCIGSKIGVK
jgi:hypothetical protein